jgi:predicted transcriptional regulator
MAPSSGRSEPAQASGSGGASGEPADIHQRILRALRRQPGLKFRELAEAAGVKWQDLPQPLKDLIAEGKLEKTEQAEHFLAGTCVSLSK